MADNVAITAGAGTTVAADEVTDGTLGTVKVQYVKLMDGTLDGTSKATINSNGSLAVQGYQPTATTFSGVIATGALASTAAGSYNIATVTLRTFTGTTPSVTFKLQASDDNTNWVDIQGINNSSGVVATSFTQATALTAGTAGISVDYTIGAYTNVRINVTAISGASATAAFGLAFQSMPYEASPGAIAQGTAAAGSAISGNPVLVGGSDGTNARAISTTTAGLAKIDVSGSAANATAGLLSVKIDQTTPGTTNNVAITPPTLTKATQGSTGLSTQDLKDAGRTSVGITASVASTATAETLITITKSEGLAATGTSSSTTITTGKRFRIQAITASARNSTGTTAGVATIKIRAAVAGATTTASPLQFSSSAALPAAATSVNFPNINIPDGFEIDSNGATNTYGVTITHPQWVTGSVVATFDISILGYYY